MLSKSSVSGILASLAAVGFSTETLIQFAAVAAMGGGVGAIIGRRITAIELPQMVAALHSVVGLAAVLTSIASVLSDVGHASTLHLVSAYLGVLIGIICRFFTAQTLLTTLYRWYNIYWLSRRILQAGRQDVFQAIAPSWTPSH